jgi:FkbM family methyltransferase
MRIKKEKVIFNITTKNDIWYGKIFWQNYSTWENQLFTTIKNNVTKNDVFIDIGAAIGAVCFYASYFSHKVYAIEPHHSIFGLLKKNLNLNRSIKNLKIFNCAIHNKNSVVKHQANKIFSSINFHRTSGQVKNICVYSLPYFFKKNKINPKNAFIKIDIEGGEFSLLANNNFIKFLKKNNMRAYVSLHFNFFLDQNKYYNFFYFILRYINFLKEFIIVCNFIFKFKNIQINGVRTSRLKIFNIKHSQSPYPDIFVYD